MHKYILFGTAVLVAMLVYSTVRQRRKTEAEAGVATYDDMVQDTVTAKVDEPIHQVVHQPYSAGVPVDELKPYSPGEVVMADKLDDARMAITPGHGGFDDGGSFGGSSGSDSSCDSSSSSSDGGSSGGGCD